MSPWLGALLATAAAAVTWLHLSARARRQGRLFPSVQHLGALPLPMRPTWPVEQPWRWLLRVAALALLALALWGLGRGPGGAAARVALVDPASGEEGWRRARALPGVDVVAGFEGGRPRVEGNDARAARVRATLEACSARPVDCLMRAARVGEARPVVISDVVDGAWSAALAGAAFDFVRVQAAGPAGASQGTGPASTPSAGRAPGQRAGETPATSGTAAEKGTDVPAASPTSAARADRSSLSPPLALWRAALEAAAPVEPNAPRVGGRPLAAATPSPALPDLRVATEPGTGPSPCPPVERTDPRALHWDDLSALATGRSAVPAEATLRFQAQDGTALALDGLAARTADGTLCLASTDRELGRWAHDGTLVLLGRALRPWVTPPLVLRQAPPGGTQRWIDAAGATTAVGLGDVAPGTYRRADGRVVLSLARPEPLAPEPLTDADLVTLGGTPAPESPSHRWPWPLWALLAVALLRLADLPERIDISSGCQTPSKALRYQRLAAILQALGLLIIAAAIVGAGWWREPLAERWARLLGRAPAGVEAPLNAVGVRTVRGTTPLPCTAATSESPCVEVARAAAELEPSIDTRVGDPAAPRLDILDVQLPSEVPLGMAAQVRVDLRLQHARDVQLTVEARAPGAPPVTVQRAIPSDEAVLRLEMPLLPAAEGVVPVVVSARAGPAVDGQLRTLAVRRRTVRRLLLAGAPSWEARRAAEVLDLAPATVDVVTRVGRTATASRPRTLPAPANLLTTPATLDAYSSIVLVDPGDWLGPEALTGLTAWVERGGGLVVLGRGRLPGSLAPGISPAGPAGPPHRLQARWAGNSWAFEGFDAAEGALSPGSVVLGEAGPSERTLRPWVVGRTSGKGRVLQLLAEDAWRLSPPGGDATRLSTLLGSAVAWVEAARPAPPVTVSDDARSVLWADDAGRHRTPFGLGRSVLGLELASLPAALDLPIRLRADAAREGRPWIEVGGWTELADLWSRAPAPATLRRQQLIRTHPATWLVWAALLATEIGLRRRQRRMRSDATDEPAQLQTKPLRRSA